MSLWSLQKRRQKKSRSVYSYHDLKQLIYQMLNEYTEAQLYDAELGENVYRNQEEYRRLLSGSIRGCCSGNWGAKETVKELIRSYLVRELKITEEEVRSIIPFDKPEHLSPREVFELLMYLEDPEGDRGFERIWRQSGWGSLPEPVTVTEEMIREYFSIKERVFDYCDCMMILSQLLFADTVGLGVIDSLNQQKGSIEEIQLGMNGVSETVYNYRTELTENNEKVIYARDGIHLLVEGKTIWLRFLGFGTEEEMQRVLRNLIKDSHAGELTRNNPMIVVDTLDGRRVSVSRPPMTDSWVGLIRKFDTVGAVTLQSLYEEEPEGILLATLIGWLVRSGRNVAITGEMASGKTTLFRACLRETNKERNLRIIEADSFELNVRNFLPERNSMTMRVSDTTPADEVLAFARKTTGQIFAVGEINSASVAVVMMDLSKIATQLLFSAHYVTTEEMIADFVNAKLCLGGYTDEGLARKDVARSLGFDIHLRNRFGKRSVQYISEVVLTSEIEDREPYEIRTLYQRKDERNHEICLKRPSEITYRRAKAELTQEEFESFSNFFEQMEARI